MADRKKISKKTLAKAFHHWYYGHLTCFSQEHMQTFGYLTSMLPIVEEMYDTKEEQVAALKRHLTFFNVTPAAVGPVLGVTAAMEEAKANGADIDEGIRRFRYPYKDVDQAVPEWDCLYLCNKRDDIDYTTMYRAPLKEWEEEHHE